MFSNIILNLLPQPTFIIFLSTFAGALAGESYKEVSDGIPCSFIKFSANFFASWMIAFAVVLLLKGWLYIQNNEILIGTSILFGFSGHKDSMVFAKKLMYNKFNVKNEDKKE